MVIPPPDQVLAGRGGWAYLIVAAVLLLEAVPVLGILLPAQLFMLGAGFLVALHELHGSYLVVIGTLSLFVADVVSFHLGRTFGLHVIDRLPSHFARRARRLSAGLAGHLGKTLTLGKFLGPARALGPPLAGAARVRWPRFLLWELLGSFVWVFAISAVGFLVGHSYVRLERAIGRGSVVLVLALIVAYLTFMRFRAVRENEGEEAVPDDA
jgi:membrane protein DedA with SNARE-associated domain